MKLRRTVFGVAYLVVAALSLTSCSNSEKSHGSQDLDIYQARCEFNKAISSTNPKCPKNKEGFDNLVWERWLDQFIETGCKDLNYWTLGAGNWSMETIRTDPEDFPVFVIQNPNSGWGNEVERALLISGIYLMNMSPDLHAYSGAGDLNKAFRMYKKIADNTARMLCYESQPNTKQIKLAEQLLPILTGNWVDFINWKREALAIAQNESHASSDALLELQRNSRPVCTEYPTTLPDYKIIKCSLP